MRRVVAVVVLAALCPGCFVGALASTRHERLDESRVETRVVQRPADVDGTYCYVDEKVRVHEKVLVSSTWGTFGGVEAILAGLAIGGTSGDDTYYAAGMALDGVLAFTYFAARNRKEASSFTWQETLETGTCHH